jgi:hypothetical protein
MFVNHIFTEYNYVMSTTGALSNYSEQNIIRAMVRNTAFPTPPANVYVALWTVMPDEAGAGGTEVTGGSYARQAISTGTSGTGVGSGFTDVSAGNGATSNVSDITFPVATAGWGTILGIAVMDALSNGNQLWRSTLTTSSDILINDQFVIRAGQLTFSVD